MRRSKRTCPPPPIVQTPLSCIPLSLPRDTALPQDLLHTHDKFVGPIPADMDAGTRALHSFLPRLFDSKVVMAKAMAAGMKLPRTVLGEAHQWLREKYPATPEGGGTGTEPAEGAAEKGQQVDGTTAVATAGGEANGDSKTNGEAAAAAAGASPPVAEGAEAAALEGDVEALERARRGWDAVLAPGFEERYKDGGLEHEAGFDAYLVRSEATD